MAEAAVALALGLAAGLTQAQALALQPLRGSALQKALEGTWCAPRPEGGCWAVDVLGADGQLLACGRRPDDDEPFHGSGPYTVTGDRLCYQTAQASESFWVRPGTRFCVRIVGVNVKRHVFEDLDSGHRHALLRLEPSEATAALRSACPLRP
jgi:hypothetical protein